MIEQFEVDGVPALFSKATGSLRAGLVFRVGMADEPLPKRGLTHLLEHLALHSAGVADHVYNGATAVEQTVFVTAGSETEIVKFFEGVCASLRELPIQRLAVEKEILRTEASSRGSGAAEQFPMWRHGARDYGAPSFPEWGLRAITAEDLKDWANRFFVRENAVLWIAGPKVPDGLRLDLPAGERRPAPVPSSALPVTPAYFHGANGSVVWESVVPASPAAMIFAGVLERVLFRALRQEGGLSYTVSTDYERRQNGTAVIMALADALPDKQDAVLGGMIDVLARMRLGLLDEADVTAVINQRSELSRLAEERGDRVARQASNLLAGRPVLEVDAAVAGTRAVTVSDVAAVARTAWGSGLLRTPGPATADWAGYTAAPTTSAHQVSGQAYPSLEDPDNCRVILGEEGVTLVNGTELATVRFADCVIAHAWPDGARQLIGSDAIVVRLEPTLHHGLAAAIPWLDSRLPAGLRVDQPAREPSAIPVPQPRVAPPPPPPPSAARPAASRATRNSLIANLAIFGVFGILAAWRFIGLATGSATDDTDGIAGSAPIMGLFFIFCVVRVVLALKSARKYWGRR